MKMTEKSENIGIVASLDLEENHFSLECGIKGPKRENIQSYTNEVRLYETHKDSEKESLACNSIENKRIV